MLFLGSKYKSMHNNIYNNKYKLRSNLYDKELNENFHVEGIDGQSNRRIYARNIKSGKKMININ